MKEDDASWFQLCMAYPSLLQEIWHFLSHFIDSLHILRFLEIMIIWHDNITNFITSLNWMYVQFAVCSGIRMEAVAVPKIRFRGQNASLLCQYELEDNEELFSLKWYKEETEFYRYRMFTQLMFNSRYIVLTTGTAIPLVVILS